MWNWRLTLDQVLRRIILIVLSEVRFLIVQGCAPTLPIIEIFVTGQFSSNKKVSVSDMGPGYPHTKGGSRPKPTCRPPSRRGGVEVVVASELGPSPRSDSCVRPGQAFPAPNYSV